MNSRNTREQEADVEAFWVSLGMVFLAELGDKTQLVALSLAARFRTGVVLAGILVATLAVHVLSVILGGCAGNCLPRNWISLLAGLAFIGFGFWTLRGDCLDEETCKINKKCPSPFWLVTVTFFLAELGDKTMLTTVALATEAKYSIVLVWIGSSLGMVVSDGLAIAIGKMLGKSLPQRAVKIGASTIFFAFGLFSMYDGGKSLPVTAWAGAAVVVFAFTAVYLRGALGRREEMPAVLVPIAEPAEDELVGAGKN